MPLAMCVSVCVCVEREKQSERRREKREREVWLYASGEETAVYTQRAELSRCCCFIHTLLKALVFKSSRNGCNIASLLHHCFCH